MVMDRMVYADHSAPEYDLLTGSEMNESSTTAENQVLLSYFILT